MQEIFRATGRWISIFHHCNGNGKARMHLSCLLSASHTLTDEKGRRSNLHHSLFISRWDPQIVDDVLGSPVHWGSVSKCTRGFSDFPGISP